MATRTYYAKALEEVQRFFSAAKFDNNRGHELHIRKTKASIAEVNNFIQHSKAKYIGQEKDTRYSTSYQTCFFELDDIFFPIVFCCGEHKVNSLDSICQKQLTPESLKLKGTFRDISSLLEQIKKSLSKSNPPLNSIWKSTDPEELQKLLLKMALQVAYSNQTFNDRECLIIKHHAASLGKDYGEVLAAIQILKEHGNVTIQDEINSIIYDLAYTDEYGVTNKINIKSGGGSGQTFKGIAKEFNAISTNDFQKGSIAHVCLKIINSLISNEKGIQGRDRIFLMAKETQSIPNTEILGKIMEKISILFFNGNEIDKETYSPPETFADYEIAVKSIFEDLGIDKVIGIPKGSHEAHPSEFYEKDPRGKENAIIFTMATLICAYFPEKVVTHIMEKLLKTKIHIIEVSFNGGETIFSIPQKISYKFHYWGNFKNPTNNLPGFKTITKT